MLGLVRMDGYAGRLPRELSGGQQQRVALARTLAVSPRVLLLDEPFGALDKNLRLDMQIEVKRLQRELDITTIMVTHDQEEALSLADRVAVMNHGRVEQFARPDEIYDRPASLFVATFVGTRACCAGSSSTAALECAAGRLALGAGVTPAAGAVVVRRQAGAFPLRGRRDRGTRRDDRAGAAARAPRDLRRRADGWHDREGHDLAGRGRDVTRCRATPCAWGSRPARRRGVRGMTSRTREWQLVLPLALFFALFVFAPLALLGR
jgi:hypothetical protein